MGDAGLLLGGESRRKGDSTRRRGGDSGRRRGESGCLLGDPPRRPTGERLLGERGFRRGEGSLCLFMSSLSASGPTFSGLGPSLFGTVATVLGGVGIFCL